MTQKTILNDTHRALGAKMVDFGGWDMPIHYGSQIDEHHLVRQDAGMFDVSHMTVVDLHGAKVRDFLRQLVANSVDKLKTPGKALYTAMLNPQGGVIDDLIIYFRGEDFFRLVVNAATREKDLAWINEQAKAFDVKVTERPEFGMIAVQGPNAREKVLGLLREEDRAAIGKLGKFVAGEAKTIDGIDVFVARTGYTGEDGFEIVVPRSADRRVLERAARRGREAGRPRRARHAAPGSRHEPLRPGHGRHRVAVRSRAGLDGRARRRPRLHRPRRARGAEGQRRAAADDRPGDGREGRAAPRPEGADRERRRRDPLGHVLADAGQGDRVRARAGRRIR